VVISTLLLPSPASKLCFQTWHNKIQKEEKIQVWSLAAGPDCNLILLIIKFGKDAEYEIIQIMRICRYQTVCLPAGEAWCSASSGRGCLGAAGGRAGDKCRAPKQDRWPGSGHQERAAVPRQGRRAHARISMQVSTT
jgi:hypothetical protein